MTPVPVVTMKVWEDIFPTHSRMGNFEQNGFAVEVSSRLADCASQLEEICHYSTFTRQPSMVAKDVVGVVTNRYNTGAVQWNNGFLLRKSICLHFLSFEKFELFGE